MNLQELRQLGWLKGKVLASNSSFLADIIDSQLAQAAPAGGPPLLTPALPTISLLSGPVAQVVGVGENLLLDVFELLLRHFYSAAQPTVTDLDQLRLVLPMLRLADYLGRCDLLGVYDVELWHWVHCRLVPALPSGFDANAFSEDVLLAVELAALGRGAAWLFREAVSAGALLPWALRQVNLGLGRPDDARPPWWQALNRALAADKALAAVALLALWDDSEDYAAGVLASPADLAPAADSTGVTEWASNGLRQMQVKALKVHPQQGGLPVLAATVEPVGDYRRAAQHLLAWMAHEGWGRTALPASLLGGMLAE